MSSNTFLFDKKYWLLRHALFWAFFYLDEILNLVGLIEYEETHFSHLLVIILIDIVLVYSNIYLLVPKFLKKNKFGLYIFLTAIQVFLTVQIIFWTYDAFHPEEIDLDAPFDVTSYIIQSIQELGILFPAVAIKLFKSSWEDNQRIQELDQLEYKTELNKLKKQVNPHFLFNSLNAIYVQAKKGSQNVSDSIMALSELMRYQTYDALEEKVLLSKEVEFLINYLEMEKMRRTGFEYNLDYDTSISNIRIEPLLILPLVENACKYSTHLEDEEKCWVNVSFDFDLDTLRLRVQNNLGSATFSSKEAYSGQGQANVKRRLELLYPERHSFRAHQNEGAYYVDISIKVK